MLNLNSTLHLSANALHYELPTELGAATRLRALWLVHTRLSGSVPASLGRMASLQELGPSKAFKKRNGPFGSGVARVFEPDDPLPKGKSRL